MLHQPWLQELLSWHSPTTAPAGLLGHFHPPSDAASSPIAGLSVLAQAPRCQVPQLHAGCHPGKASLSWSALVAKPLGQHWTGRTHIFGSHSAYAGRKSCAPTSTCQGRNKKHWRNNWLQLISDMCLFIILLCFFSQQWQVRFSFPRSQLHFSPDRSHHCAFLQLSVASRAAKIGTGPARHGVSSSKMRMCLKIRVHTP